MRIADLFPWVWPWFSAIAVGEHLVSVGGVDSLICLMFRVDGLEGRWMMCLGVLVLGRDVYSPLACPHLYGCYRRDRLPAWRLEADRSGYIWVRVCSGPVNETAEASVLALGDSLLFRAARALVPCG